MALENQQIGDNSNDPFCSGLLTREQARLEAEKYAQEHLHVSFQKAIELYKQGELGHSVIRYQLEDWLKWVGRENEIIQD